MPQALVRKLMKPVVDERDELIARARVAGAPPPEQLGDRHRKDPGLPDDVSRSFMHFRPSG